MEIPQPQSQPQREVNPNPSVEPINNVEKEKKPSTDVEDNKVAFKSEIPSDKPQTSKKNQEQIETKKETENKEVLPKEEENKFLLQEAWDLDYSFESLRHDIYYPEFSKEELSKDSPDSDQKPIKANGTKDIKVKESLEIAAIPPNNIAKMQKALFKAEIEELGTQMMPSKPLASKNVNNNTNNEDLF